MLESKGADFHAAELTFVLGHEVQHALNRGATGIAYQQFRREAASVARGKYGEHDYSQSVGSLIAAHRRDEAAAQIAGWNALLDSVKCGKPNAKLQDMYEKHAHRIRDFMDASEDDPVVYTLKPGLTVNPDLSISPTSANVEAMGRHYFDKPADDARLGHNGTSDYANYYGAYAATVIGQFERAHSRPSNGVPPQVMLDMAGLGLDERLMEENGIDLGRPGARQRYVDSNHADAAPKYFDHTASSHRHVPIQSLPVQADEALCPSDRALHGQILGQVQRLGLPTITDGSGASGRVAASLLVLAREQGFASVDHVLLGSRSSQDSHPERVFIVQGQLVDPAHQRASLDVGAAAKTPVEESLQRLAAMTDLAAAARETEAIAYRQQVEARDQAPARRLAGMPPGY